MKKFVKQMLAVGAAVLGLLGSQQAASQNCTMIHTLEGIDYTQRTQVGLTIPQEGTFSVTQDVPGTEWSKVLMFMGERDCLVDAVRVEITVGDTTFSPSYGAFGGMQCSASKFEWKTGNEDWAGCYAVAQDTLPAAGAYSAGSTVTISRTEALIANAAACQDTSTLKFDEAFGGARVDCTTDTYENPAIGAETWAGFSDGGADGNRQDIYPLVFEHGGEIAYSCNSAGGSSIKFKLEDVGGGAATETWESDPIDCSAGGGRASGTVSIPSQGATEFDSFLLYLSAGTKATVTNVSITAAAAPPAGGGGGGVPATPVPALPFWALLGLAGLVGLFGFRRR